MNDTTLGSTPQSEQQDREAVYYDTTDAPAPSLFAPYATVTAPYSTIGALESMEGAAAIVSTAIDLAHFTGAIARGSLPNFPGPPAFPGWPQMYYTLSTQIPSYETSAAPYGAGWDLVPSNVVPVPLLPYDNYNFLKDGGYPGTASSVAATADGYAFAAVFNGGDNTQWAPQSLIFWPNCATPPPQAAPGLQERHLRAPGSLQSRRQAAVEHGFHAAVFATLFRLDERSGLRNLCGNPKE